MTQLVRPSGPSRSWIDCGVASTDSGTNTNLRDGRAGDAADLTKNGASSSEESIRINSWWMAPPTSQSLNPHCGLSAFDDGPGFFASVATDELVGLRWDANLSDEESLKKTSASLEQTRTWVRTFTHSHLHSIRTDEMSPHHVRMGGRQLRNLRHECANIVQRPSL